MKKCLALAVWINCLNACYSQDTCNNCTSNIDLKYNCRCSSPFTLLVNYDTLVGLYCKDHSELDCRNCKYGGSLDTMCIFSHTKHLFELKFH